MSHSSRFFRPLLIAVICLAPSAWAQVDEDELVPLVPLNQVKSKVRGLQDTQRVLKFEKSGTLALPLSHQVLVNGAVRLEAKTPPNKLKPSEVLCVVGYQRDLRIRGKQTFLEPLEIKLQGEEVTFGDPLISRESSGRSSEQAVFVTIPFKDHPILRSLTCSKYGRAPMDFSWTDLMRGLFGGRPAAFTVTEGGSTSAPSTPSAQEPAAAVDGIPETSSPASSIEPVDAGSAQ